MDLNAIMNNIYGEGSSQNFDSVGFSGGSLRQHQRNANIKYLDETAKETDTASSFAIDNSYRASKISSAFPDIHHLTGGADASSHIYPSAEYIEDAGLQKFIKEFYLHYLVTNAHKNMILVVPSSATLDKLVSDFKATLKKEGIDALSPEASKFAAKTELPFKNYIFDVYGRSSSNNDGYLYQVDASFPDKTSNDIYRRTNRASKQYFFKFSGANKIEVANDEKFSNSTTLKLLGKCDRAVFVLQGDIPDAASGKSKVVKASMAGGSKRSSPLRHEFLKCVRRYGELDQGAYDFIARVAHASGTSSVAKYYSGDFVHTAFSLIAANEEDGQNFDLDTSDDVEPDFEHSKLIDQYKPVKNIVKMDKVQSVLPRILRDATGRSNSGTSANVNFIANLRRMYSAIKAPKYMLAADVACALTKKNDSYDSVRNALNIMSAVEETNPEAGLSGGAAVYTHATKLRDGVSTPLIRSVYSALSYSPFIGSIAKEYTPILIGGGKLKPRSAFEDQHSALLNDNDDDDVNVLAKDSCPDGDCGDDEPKSKDDDLSNDFDIKAFF